LGRPCRRLSRSFPGWSSPRRKVIVVSKSPRPQGWSMDYQGLTPVDVLCRLTPDDAGPTCSRPRRQGTKAVEPHGQAGNYRLVPRTSSWSTSRPRPQDCLGDRDVTLAHIFAFGGRPHVPVRNRRLYGFEKAGLIGGGQATRGRHRARDSRARDGSPSRRALRRRRFQMANTAGWTAAITKSRS